MVLLSVFSGLFEGSLIKERYMFFCLFLSVFSGFFVGVVSLQGLS